MIRLAHFLFWSIGFLIGLAVSDFHEAMLGVEAPQAAHQGQCPDPSKAQVLRMDNSNQISQVLDRGVNCVTVLRGM